MYLLDWDIFIIFVSFLTVNISFIANGHPLYPLKQACSPVLPTDPLWHEDDDIKK